MTIPNEPHKTVILTEGETEAFELFLTQRKKEAEQKFVAHQAAMLSAASDVELCIILEKKLKGEPTGDRHQFLTNKEKMAKLLAEQTDQED